MNEDRTKPSRLLLLHVSLHNFVSIVIKRKTSKKKCKSNQSRVLAARESVAMTAAPLSNNRRGYDMADKTVLELLLFGSKMGGRGSPGECRECFQRLQTVSRCLAPTQAAVSVRKYEKSLDGVEL